MTDSTDDVDWYEDEANDNYYEDYIVKRYKVIEYCYDHLDKMWAARIVGILLGCDFRDAKEHVDIFFEEYE